MSQNPSEEAVAAEGAWQGGRAGASGEAGAASLRTRSEAARARRRGSYDVMSIRYLAEIPGFILSDSLRKKSKGEQDSWNCWKFQVLLSCALVPKRQHLNKMFLAIAVLVLSQSGNAHAPNLRRLHARNACVAAATDVTIEPESVVCSEAMHSLAATTLALLAGDEAAASALAGSASVRRATARTDRARERERERARDSDC